VYIGFAVADGRTTVVAVEVIVASAFVVMAAVGSQLLERSRTQHSEFHQRKALPCPSVVRQPRTRSA
jgi:hypothetical protein